MRFLTALNNNLKHDIWGNFLMSKELGPMVSCGYLARKSLALAKAMLANRTILVNNKLFYDTWN